LKKSIEARYKKQAKSDIFGKSIFSIGEIDDIKQSVGKDNQTDIIKTMNLVDEKQNIIATFNKTLYTAEKYFYKKTKKS